MEKSKKRSEGMKLKLKVKALVAAAALALSAGGAHAQISGNVVKIGILNDQSSLYADLSGQGSVIAARMAVDDFKAKDKGLNVEIIFADHQNKADVGSQIANKWYDSEGVDVIVDTPNSGVALAVNQITKDKGKVFIHSGAATSDLTGKACSPSTVHWTYDTWMLANGTGKAIVKTGGDSWFFITADYAFGHALERDTEAVVVKNGGKGVGKVRAPINTQDFSSFLLQAQASKAKIIGLANAGGDTINSIKQASEFGIVKGGQSLAGLLVFITDVHGLGLEKAQGLIFTETFYWDLNDQTRAWRKRFAAANGGKAPSMGQAGGDAGGLPSLQALFSQLLIGLINGSFYALLSLGLAVIFGLLNIINFTHGAQYMMGAFVAYFLLNKAGLGYWWALVLVPIGVGITGVVIERLMLQRLYKLDHLYGLLLTFGLALIIQGAFRNQFGSAGLPYSMPESLTGGNNLGFMYLPKYRAWVIIASLAICLGTWFLIERTKLGAYLRAATENPSMVQAFGVNVPRMITLTYGFGVGLAALAAVFAAPIYQVSPQMGSSLIIVVFAVVVIGGMGSIMGAIVTGFGLGIVEGLTKVFYPEASNTVIFVIMAIVLMFRPQGLFGQR